LYGYSTGFVGEIVVVVAIFFITPLIKESHGGSAFVFYGE
jgi:hypothetical protein